MLRQGFTGIFGKLGNNGPSYALYPNERPSVRLHRRSRLWGGTMGMKESNMKKLLTALVACGLVVGCGGDTSGTKSSTVKKTETKDAGGTVKKEEVKKEESKTETKKP